MNNNIIAGLGKAKQFAFWGAGGGAIGALIAEILYPIIIQDNSKSLGNTVIQVAIWFGIIGATIAIALLSASFQYLKRGIQLAKAIQNGIGVGLLAGAIAGSIAQYLYSSIGDTSPNEFLRIFCWGIAGGLLGLGLSFRIPNLGKLRGMGGGLAGGILGGSIFVLLSLINENSQVAGRFLGIAAIGFSIGLMIAIIETVFREIWLEIRYNPRESRTVSLGSQPVTIGSNANLCTVYIYNAPPIALRYQLVEGKVLCEDIPAGTTHQVQPGSQQMIGAISIVVCGAGASSQSFSKSNHTSSPLLEKTLFQSPGGFSLHLKRQVIPLSNGTRLSSKEILGLEPQSGDGIVAQVSYNPNDPTVLGLKNCSLMGWLATLSTGEQREIPPGRSIKLAVHTKIKFGAVEGEIR
ncbi:hypothetical protein B7O87_05045 [Cylindrospermopsis raciborskii CENA303]|uniref:Uncharacterized protein n=1 Tax=Cylindrospermopsis raciborskii CENA303 TaxID=1170769 RepID=A0A1X4G9T7_9CYAN|nr:hypothetical protein [Cylindrospermopsis raciborskii]OSO93919.1 hypothetical protein B7O87_05045 [Cylindrospermopsis raciborskii CENA303]